MAKIRANGISIEYETFGDEGDSPLLLVMGLGAQMIHWDNSFCNLLAEKGHYVIRFDNRDVGLSEKMSQFPIPDMSQMMAEFLAGRTPDVPYTLEDMADDGMGLLSGLGIEKAHICGASLGGMVTQTMAINFPDRVKTLTSIMSSTGNPNLPPATPEAQGALLSTAENNEAAVVQRALNISAVIGSPGFEFDRERLTDRAREAFARGFYPDGISRQMAAVAANGDRRARLNKICTPTLIVHGTEDCLVPVEAGIDTHNNIKSSELLLIEGMGHDLPMGAWDQIVDGITRLAANNS